MNFYRRKLPHWQPEGAQYFITFRLAGSLPRQVIIELKKLRKQFKSNGRSGDSIDSTVLQRRIFQKYEEILNTESVGPVWLKNPAIAAIVRDAIHYRHLREYDLFAYCIMSNHVHIVFRHLSGGLENSAEDDFPITKIMQELKRYTAYKSNKVLGRKGAFWQPESYDRVIRNQNELERTIRYTLNNPVKAKLVNHWKEWPYNYCKQEFSNTFS